MAKKTEVVTTEPDLSYIVEALRPLAVPVEELVPDPANARKHDDANLTAIRASLRVYGQRKPVVVNKRNGVVEAGNGTLAAAISLKWTHVAAVYVDDDPSTAAGFSIADNRSAELADWDTDALDKLLREIDTGDEDLQEMLSKLAEDHDMFDMAEVEPPELASGDRDPFQQMTFTLHDSQVETIKTAMERAKSAGSFDGYPNENSNGNALARIAEAYCGAS